MLLCGCGVLCAVCRVRSAVVCGLLCFVCGGVCRVRVSCVARREEDAGGEEDERAGGGEGAGWRRGTREEAKENGEDAMVNSS